MVRVAEYVLSGLLGTFGRARDASDESDLGVQSSSALFMETWQEPWLGGEMPYAVSPLDNSRMTVGMGFLTKTIGLLCSSDVRRWAMQPESGSAAGARRWADLP